MSTIKEGPRLWLKDSLPGQHDLLLDQKIQLKYKRFTAQDFTDDEHVTEPLFERFLGGQVN